MSRNLAIALFTLAAVSATAQKPMTFSCSDKGHAFRLTATSLFSPTFPTDTPQFGFDLATTPTTYTGDSCSSEKPFFFSLGVNDGDYKVTVVLGGPAASTTTIRAESRRLFLLEKTLPAGASATESFIVNVRTPEYKDPATGADAKVKLKPREIGALDWDPKLTLEFNGEHPAVRSITVERVTNVPTVYLAGDSTVVDQDKEPWAAWGQMLPLFVTDKVSIANNAESGETIKSFLGERRWPKILTTLKPGDYVLIQFAHNDQKPGAGFVSIPEYKDLMKKFIAEAAAKGATTILVTAMNRRNFDATGKINMTLGDYPQATRDVAADLHLGLIDLNAMSKTLFEAMGPDGTLKAFVHYPAGTFPGQDAELKDDTHFNAYGAYELARAIVQSIRDQHLPLAQYLRKGIAPFNPAQPDPIAIWHLPPSPSIDTTTPYGR